MRYIKYIMANSNLSVELPYTESNEEMARREAENGEYIVEDDGLPEPVAPETDAPTWDELAAALQEGVDAV